LRQSDQVAQLGRDSGRTVYLIGNGDQLEGDTGESLEQGIVELAGEPVALVEHGRESSFNRPLPHPPQGPLSPLAVGHINQNTHELHHLTGLIEHRLAEAVHVADRPVGANDAEVHLVASLLP